MMKERPLSLSADEAARRVRVPISREAGESVLASMSPGAAISPPSDEYERNKIYKNALYRNNPDELAAALCMLYRVTSPGYPEEHHEEDLEEALIGELSHVLGKKPGPLKREIRKAAGAFSLPDRAKELAKHKQLPEHDDFETLGAFAVEGTLVAGEMGEGIEVAATPGIWYAYFKEPTTTDPRTVLRVVYSGRVHHAEDLGVKASSLSKFGIEGASMSVVELIAKRDKSFRRKLDEGRSGILGQFGIEVDLGGDGSGEVFVFTEGGAATLVDLVAM